MKTVGSYNLFCHDFESRLCSLREQALTQGPQWIQGKQKGDVIFRVKETTVFQDLGLKAAVSGKFFIKEIYKTKKGAKTLYRLQLELSYWGSCDKKAVQRFSGYMALQE